GVDLFRAKAGAELAAIHPRQHDVEDHHVISFVPGTLEPGEPGRGDRDLVAVGLEPAANEAADAFVVFHEEQVHHAATLSSTIEGSSMTARVPPPSRGASRARPPCASASALTMLRPNPAPSPRFWPRQKRSNRRSH